MTFRLSARLVSFVVLGLIAVLALLLVLRATPEGLSLTDDSIAYIAGARSMLSGNGYREAWLASNGPVTHFPPGYPAALSLLGFFGLDPLRGARFLGASLYALNAAVLGILGWRMTRSLPAGVALAALFVVNDSLLRVHSTALSEPLFIFLGLIAFWLLDLYNERDHHWLWLIAAGSAVGMAFLTRYAALALAATMIAALLLIRPTWRQRLTSIGIFVLSLLPWMISWTLRNEAIGGTTTNRTIVWHPITPGDLGTAARTVSSFLMPVEPWRQELMRVPGLFPGLALGILAGIAIWLVAAFRRQTSPSGAPGGKFLALLSGLYTLGYLAGILATMSLFDAATKFKLRILAPAYVSILILAVAAAVWAWPRWRAAVVIAGLAVFALSIYGQTVTVNEWMKGGQGYASFRWYDSQAMAYLRSLHRGVIIYTNEPGAVYLYTGIPGYVLPDRVDPVTTAPRSDFEAGIQRLQADVRSGNAVLALFSGGDAPAEDAAALSAGLPLAHKSGGAEIFGAIP